MTYIASDTYDQDSSVKDYIMLMKPRVMSLVVFTALCGMILAPGEINPLIGFTSILSIAIGAGSAGAINMWYDRDIDSVMTRTQKRPIVTGKIKADEALAFGIITSVISIILMIIATNILSGFLLALTIFYYIFIYTIFLKRISIYNIVIGGVAGAIPPMIGWSSVSGNITMESLTLFAIIFIWTPPHSWALALFKLKDYKNSEIPMMPVIKGKLHTKKQIFFYSTLMIGISMMPYFLGMVSFIYILLSSFLGAVFLYYATLLFYDKKDVIAQKLFWYSIFYLFMIFLLLIVTAL